MQGDISALVHNPPAFTAQTWEHIPANPLTHIPLGQAHLLSSLNLLSSILGSNRLHEGRKIKRLLMPTAAYLILQHKTGLALAGSPGSSMTRGVHTTGTVLPAGQGEQAVCQVLLWPPRRETPAKSCQNRLMLAYQVALIRICTGGRKEELAEGRILEITSHEG